jgi:hypothetical protein
MMQRLFAVIAGVIVAMVLVTAGDVLVGRLYPIGAIDFTDPVAVKAAVAAMPLGANLVMLCSWIVAGIGGAATAAFMGRQLRPAVMLAAALAVGIAYNGRQMGHPAWMIVVGAGATAIAAIGAGALVASKRKAEAPATS